MHESSDGEASSASPPPPSIAKALPLDILLNSLNSMCHNLKTFLGFCLSLYGGLVFAPLYLLSRLLTAVKNKGFTRPSVVLDCLYSPLLLPKYDSFPLDILTSRCCRQVNCYPSPFIYSVASHHSSRGGEELL